MDRAKAAVVTTTEILAAIRQARSRPWREIPWRTARVLKRFALNRRERARVESGMASVSPSDLRKALRTPLAEALERLGRIPLGRMNASGETRRDLARAFRQAHPAVFEDILGEAENACAHRFDLLGSGLTDLGPSIDWSRDFKSGFVWPRQYVKEMVLVDLARGADLKVPWDLSRGYQLVRLGQAFWLTGDERFSRELMAQWSSWVDANPVLQTCNWGNAMESAIRAANFCVAFTLTRDASAQTSELRERFLRSALEHGRFIIANLERFEGYPSSNHYLSDLVGLVYLGALTPFFNESRDWLETGLRGLEREALVQVGEDGFDYEGSTNYHRLVGELLASAFALARQNGHEASRPAWDRVVAMAEATLAYTRPDGRAPLIGDVDNGRLHQLTPELPDDHRSLLGLVGVTAARGDLLPAAGRARAEGFWWGEEPTNTAATAAASSRLFADGGLAVLRGDGAHVVAHCGSPRGPRGHFHNDALSVEVSLRGLAWIIDPGTFAYTSSEPLRNHFRRTAAHNTLQVDDAEINEITAGELFDLRFQSHPRVLEWTRTASADTFVGEHRGFSRIPGVGVHRRRITLDKTRGVVEIQDRIEGEGRRNIAGFFHLDPEVRADIEGNRAILTRKAGREAIELRFDLAEGCSLTIIEDWVARGYGRREAAQVIVMRAPVPLPFTQTIWLSSL
jgi:Heparinase II/III-like protein/Heparinase II/III N-terminus